MHFTNFFHKYVQIHKVQIIFKNFATFSERAIFKLLDIKFQFIFKYCFTKYN